MYCTVLYCAVLYCAVLYCTVTFECREGRSKRTSIGVCTYVRNCYQMCSPEATVLAAGAGHRSTAESQPHFALHEGEGEEEGCSSASIHTINLSGFIRFNLIN